MNAERVVIDPAISRRDLAAAAVSVVCIDRSDGANVSHIKTASASSSFLQMASAQIYISARQITYINLPSVPPPMSPSMSVPPLRPPVPFHLVLRLLYRGLSYHLLFLLLSLHHVIYLFIFFSFLASLVSFVDTISFNSHSFTKKTVSVNYKT